MLELVLMPGCLLDGDYTNIEAEYVESNSIKKLVFFCKEVASAETGQTVEALCEALNADL